MHARPVGFADSARMLGISEQQVRKKIAAKEFLQNGVLEEMMWDFDAKRYPKWRPIRPKRSDPNP